MPPSYWPGVEAGVVGSVESHMAIERVEDRGGLRLQLLGPLTICRDGEPLPLPASRKVRALVGLLALAPQALSRSQLCSLLWEVANDPRGELRWCLSKVRNLLDDRERQRVSTVDDAVALDLGDCRVDAIEVSRAFASGLATLSTTRLEELCAHFNGEFLDGLALDRNPGFEAWLRAQRRQFRSLHAALLGQLAGSAEGEAVFGYLERWLALAPDDAQIHRRLLEAFARHGRLREGEAHLAAAVRQFIDDGLDPRPLREAWQAAREPRRAATVRESGVSMAGSIPARIPAADAVARPGDPAATDRIAAPRRASIAVMPFTEPPDTLLAGGGLGGGAGGGLAHDVITRLAKLRSLFVIAQGSVFALSEQGVGAEAAGRMLDVDYLVSGSLRRHGRQLAVSVELVEMRSGRIAWAEDYRQGVDDAFQVIDDIGNRIVGAIANEIEMLERNRAILKPPSSLDAWEAHHRGLWHMYRFNPADNEQARQFFATAVQLDPTFARAHAGLSFTHFQNAFQGWGPREPEVERAYAAAGQSLMVDDRDPAAHWAMGRALWLHGRQDESVIELEQAIELSPNFALGHYTLAFVHSQAGDAKAAIAYSDHSRHLSPYDPLLFGMLGARAMALVRLNQFDAAADWGVKAAARPNAHAHILAIAAYSLALAGRLAEARARMASIRQRVPAYGVDDFLSAMQMAPDGAQLFRDSARRIAAA